MVSPIGFEPMAFRSSGERYYQAELQRHVNIREEYIEALSSCVFPIVYLLAEFEPLTTRNKLLN